jgi:hypothetical protein
MAEICLVRRFEMKMWEMSIQLQKTFAFYLIQRQAVQLAFYDIAVKPSAQYQTFKTITSTLGRRLFSQDPFQCLDLIVNLKNTKALI